MESQASKLRRLVSSGEHFFATDCYNVLTGRIVEYVGFKAAYAGGHACGAFNYGTPDYGVYSQAEHVEHCRRIAAAIDIPLIADADTLGDSIVEAAHYTRRYEQAGIAGIHVEDEVNPRHSPYVNGLIPIIEMQARIEACVDARRDPDFVIIARCDEYYWRFYGDRQPGSLEKALERGRAYVEAGADALMYPVVPEADLAVLAEELSIPLCVIGVNAPAKGTGFTLAAGWAWLGAAQLHLDMARSLFENGCLNVTSHTFENKEGLTDQVIFDDVIRKWAKKTGRAIW